MELHYVGKISSVGVITDACATIPPGEYMISLDVGMCPTLTNHLSTDGRFFGCADQMIGRWVGFADLLCVGCALGSHWVGHIPI